MSGQVAAKKIVPVQYISAGADPYLSIILLNILIGLLLRICVPFEELFNLNNAL